MRLCQESEQKVINSINSVHAAEKDHGWGLKICWKTTAIAHVDSPGHPYCDWCILRHEDLSCNQIGLTWVCAKILGTQQHGYTILKIWTNQICGFFLRGKKTVNSQMFFQRPKQPSLYFFPSFREVDGKHLKNNWLGSSYLLNTNLLFNEVNGK